MKSALKMIKRLRLYWVLTVSVLISIFSFDSRASDSLFDHLCSDFHAVRNKAISYRNSNSEYVVNIQMLETYKKFETCQAKDQNIKLDPSFDLKVAEIEATFENSMNLTAEDLSFLNTKALRIFNLSKDRYLSILRSLQEKASAPDVKETFGELQQRIRTVRLTKSKACGMYNAAYDPITHSINICKEILKYPEATLVSIIAHELSHSIDPCILQFSLSSVIGSNPFFKRDAVFNESDLKNAYTTIPFEWAESDFDIPKENFQTLSQGFGFDRNPFKQNIMCLEGENSVRAIPRQDSLKNSSVEDAAGMCSSSSGSGEIQESFADWMAYEILALHLRDLSVPRKNEALYEGVLNITVNECRTLESDIEREMKRLMQNSPICGPDVEKFFVFLDKLRGQRLVGSHPNGQRRVDRLFLAQPYIRSLIDGNILSRDAGSGDLSLRYCRPEGSRE